MLNILYLESCNFLNFPIGGTLTFAKQFVHSVDAKFYLVGFGDDNEPVGKWFNKQFNDRTISYFSIGPTSQVIHSKLPKRLISYLMLRKYIKYIHLNAYFYDVVFTQTPQFVFLLSGLKWKKTVFCFAGLTNSVENSRFKRLRFLGGMYEKKLFNDLKKNFDYILAAADRESILQKEEKFRLRENSIVFFPTRFNSSIFYPYENTNIRYSLQIKENVKLIVSVGRLSYVKGWKDLIESYRFFLMKEPNSKLIFIGDGEDEEDIRIYAKDEIENETIQLIGRRSPNEISQYLNAADIFVMFSLFEGWPTAMTEALACGKNIVTSNVSGAKYMVEHNVNGFVLKDRNVKVFSELMNKALRLPNPNKVSIEKSKLYSSDRLNFDFYNIINN
ncbi:glycosyltransferase family 4 protein [Algoriphagus sediminis]|uniref:Glycosyltransferase family 4 protein n=1 Tax=Algoriphagus sediminis TaxID=3057113 RepID=A0ABT7YDY0_9BACT|nr:glycosyltransferase family 4 protein [Algoriphagus sediminis]MDN3204671.1 glycosyltransferase family 4 protein [Algoriphagus sediminis]